LSIRKTKKEKGGKKMKRLILIGLVLFSIVGLIIFFLLFQNEKEIKTPQEKLTIGLYTANKKTNEKNEITINVRIENNNLNPYVKTYDVPCESLWFLEWKKDGKPFVEKSKECKTTGTKKITIKPNQKEQYTLTKEIKEPGKYEVTLKVFDQEVTKTIEINK
jgi:hypothetical protein